MMEVMELSEELDDAKTQHEALSTLTARLSCSGGPTPCPKSGQGSDSDAFLSEGKSFGSQLRHGGSAGDTEDHEESLLRCVHRGKGHRTDAFRRASLKCLEMSLFKPRGGRESLRNPVARIVFGLYGRVAAWKHSVGTSAETKLSRGARSMTRHGFRRPEGPSVLALRSKGEHVPKTVANFEGLCKRLCLEVVLPFALGAIRGRRSATRAHPSIVSSRASWCRGATPRRAMAREACPSTASASPTSSSGCHIAGEVCSAWRMWPVEVLDLMSIDHTDHAARIRCYLRSISYTAFTCFYASI